MCSTPETIKNILSNAELLVDFKAAIFKDYSLFAGGDEKRVVYRCSDCSFGCLSEAELLIHKRIHQSSTTCSICGTVCADETDLTKHQQEHTRIFPHSCNACSYITDSQFTLAEHKYLIHDRKCDSYQCPICGLSAVNWDEDRINSHNFYHKQQKEISTSDNTTESYYSATSTYNSTTSAQYNPTSSYNSTTTSYNSVMSTGDSTRSSCSTTKSATTSVAQGPGSSDNTLIYDTSISPQVTTTKRRAKRKNNKVGRDDPLGKPTSRETHKVASTFSNEARVIAFPDADSTIDSQTMPIVNTVTNEMEVSTGADDNAWWDNSAYNAGIAASVTTNCPRCGDVMDKPSTHVCNVIRLTLNNSCVSIPCSLCHFTTTYKAESIDHCIKQHCRNWRQFEMELERKVDSISNSSSTPSDIIESLMPARYKLIADNVRLSIKSDKNTGKAEASTLNAVQYHRCVKCYQNFTSPDLLAGHLLDDRCQEGRFQLTCVSCGLSHMTSYQHLISHYLECHTEVVSSPMAPLVATLSAPITVTSTTNNQVLPVDTSHTSNGDATSANKLAPTGDIALTKTLTLGMTTVGHFLCKVCAFTAENMERYTDHILDKHTRPPIHPDFTATNMLMVDKYGCCYCDLIFTTVSDLKVHLDLHIRRSSSRRLNNSKKAKTIEPDLELSSCVKSANPTQTEIDEDLLIDKSKKLYTCHVCSYEAQSQRTLKEHLSSKHSLYRCHLCDFTSKHASGLTIHMRSHTGYRPSICTICGKGFICNSELRKHERRHAGMVERKYSCEFCGKTCSTPQHLTVHIRTHTGERPFKCSTCNFAARTKAVLTRHEATHSGVKNYQCQICDFKCTSSGTLYNHNKLKHKMVKTKKLLSEGTSESMKSYLQTACVSKRKSTNSKQQKAHTSSSSPPSDSQNIQPVYEVVSPAVTTEKQLLGEETSRQSLSTVADLANRNDLLANEKEVELSIAAL